VRVGLEVPEVGGYQRRVAHMRLLGDLYNYRLLDSRCAVACFPFYLSCAAELYLATCALPADQEQQEQGHRSLQKEGPLSTQVKSCLVDVVCAIIILFG